MGKKFTILNHYSKLNSFCVLFISKQMTFKSKFSATKLREGLFYNRSKTINSSSISLQPWPKQYDIGFGINAKKIYFSIKHYD